MGLADLAARLPGMPRHPVVGVVRLSGIITAGPVPLRRGLNLAGLASALERAFKLRNLKAVALAINSPGGSPVQSALIHKRIRALAAEHEVPVVAFCEDVAASGGYWLACAADEIFADDTSIVGSIGVIYSGFGLQDAIARIGVERRLYTAGERKSLLDPFLAQKPEDVERLRAIQSEMHDSFKALVRDRRAGKLKTPADELFTGEFWTGGRALQHGLIDGLGDLRTVMRERYGDKVKLRVVSAERPRLLRGLGLGRLGSPEPADWGAGLLAAVEERLLWARFGL